MKKNLILILTILLLTNCGKLKHEIRGVPSNYKIDAPSDFNLGPDFEKAMKLCDSRYGKKTTESEACFQDYRNYTKLRISIDMSSITTFCNESYDAEGDVKSCISDLTDLFNKIINVSN